MRDGEKHSEVTLTDIEEQYKLAVIDGMFKFFDVDVNFKEMADTYLKVAKSYKDFYENVETPNLTESNEPVEAIVLTEEKEQTEDVPDFSSFAKRTGTVKKNAEEDEIKQAAWNWSKDTPSPEPINDHYKTGIKIKNGVKYYRCHYVCEKCGNRGNHYILEKDPSITCHDCGIRMRVRSATAKGFPHVDIFTNFFIACAFIRAKPKEEDNENGTS